MTLLLFCVIFITLVGGYGLVASTPLNIDGTVSSLIISYYAWTMVMSVFTATGYAIESAKQAGTIETAISHAKSFCALLISESAASSIFNFVFSWIVVGGLSLVFGVALHLRVADVLIVMLPGLASILGFSLTVAGITLLTHKASGVLGILQFVLLGGLLLPDGILQNIAIPFKAASALLKPILLNGLPFWQANLTQIGCLLASAALYMALGVWVFGRCLEAAKRRGTIGFY
jgi:ABC-2 type transport system permease protein